ncbi:surface antigen Bsp, putative [Trichomonas vaginalis G3]|uniref:Surface antigen Bsp, putative n=1 Tax=Trichomonas vaginalis (strain ATCC PRA-98 / G3) TaxID=412133 RepID=A2E8S2_TRIV3|nr:surface antigen Bsp, putative [Trichomonas vaginalis G3]|eukprot:XP_001323127.1 surface antigen Bsp [Trichomonas vaginalis G3]
MFDRSAFSFTNILSITIVLSANSNDRQTISSFAFSGCHNLETVTIRMSSFSIGGSAFNDCFNLKNIIFPENYYISYIGSYAFENCPLESFNFKSVNSLEKGAFRNTNLREVELNLGSLRDDVFEYCSNLINVKIENELSIMESKGIFKNCHSLETVDLGPLSWTCREMFSNCYNLIEVKSSISYVGIHDETFYSCINLKILKLNPSNIGNKAFMFCNSLAYINLTETVLIKSRAFYGCQNLASVSPQVFGDEYAFAFCNSIISCNVQTFAKTGLMMNCSKLESVVIHNIQYIPDKMFYGCSSLKNIEFPDIIKFIGHYAFMGTSIEVPFLDLSETNQIGNYSFKGTKIERIKIGKDFVYSGFQCDFYYRDRCWGNEDTDENPFKDVTTITEIILGSGKQKFRGKDFQDSNNANITLGQYSYFRIENGMMIQDNEI